MTFRLYAPCADNVSVIGSWNGWNPEVNPLNKVDASGVWEGFVEGLHNYDSYKFHFRNARGEYVDHADPFAFYSELRPGTCSRLFDIENFAWHDADFLAKRTRSFDEAVSIYEIHLGSWRGLKDGRFPSYEEVADDLIPYLKENGFTHVEIMPITQYPFDGSWGYQATGFYSVDARYGNPFQLMSFVDRLHQAGFGVILDFAPVHFANGPWALREFDGTCLYEYADPHHTFSPWGSCYFDLGKDPVRSFLISAMDYFVTYFHFDGIRVDAVSNIVYWEGDKSQGENHGATEFIKRLNGKLHLAHPALMMIAEDSTDFQGVTKPLEYGGLGFDYKWDLGWMNDTLKYYSLDPIYKKYEHHKITFSMAYFYNENYMLPLSHDEVVHGKATIVQKMEGLYEGKFDQARAMYLYMYAHPGKKLNFMGNEFAQFREWDEEKEQDWFMLKYPIHDAFHHFMMDLNHLYLTHPAFWAKDFDPAGFQWVEADLNQQSVYVFKRHGGGESLLFVFNFSAETRTYDYHEVFGENMKLLLDSNLQPYHGKDPEGEMDVTPDDHGVAHLTLKPFTALCYSLYDPNNQKKKGEPKSNGKTKDVLAGDHKLHKG